MDDATEHVTLRLHAISTSSIAIIAIIVYLLKPARPEQRQTGASGGRLLFLPMRSCGIVTMGNGLECACEVVLLVLCYVRCHVVFEQYTTESLSYSRCLCLLLCSSLTLFCSHNITFIATIHLLAFCWFAF